MYKQKQQQWEPLENGLRRPPIGQNFFDTHHSDTHFGGLVKGVNATATQHHIVTRNIIARRLYVEQLMADTVKSRTLPTGTNTN